MALGRNLYNLSLHSLTPSPRSTSPIEEIPEPPSYSRRTSRSSMASGVSRSSGVDLDQKIRDAEEKIRISHRQRVDAYPASPDKKSPEKRIRDATLTLGQGEQVAQQVAQYHHQSHYPNPTPITNSRDSFRSMTASGSSSGEKSYERSTGKRRPLPAQFRQSLVRPLLPFRLMSYPSLMPVLSP